MALGTSMIALLVAILFAIVGKALWRSARNHTIEDANTRILGSCIAWLIACILALVAVLAIAKGFA